MIIESVKIRMQPERPQQQKEATSDETRRDATRSVAGKYNKPNIDTKLLRITHKKHELKFYITQATTFRMEYTV